jgi:hypothetical protein
LTPLTANLSAWDIGPSRARAYDSRLRERLTQIFPVNVGLFNLALIYFLFTDLRHSSWLLEGKNEIEPIFLSLSMLSSFTAIIPECHDAVARRQLNYATFHGAVASAFATKQVDEIRHTLIRRSDDFEV